MSKVCTTAQALSSIISYPLKHAVYSKSLKPKLADWRYGVTVCIAAIATDGFSHKPDPGDEVIVSVADKKLSLFYTSSDGAVSKQFFFHDEWVAMMAGNDITPCVEIMNASSKLLAKKPNTLPNVTNAVKTAFQNHLHQFIEDKVLSRYGMKLPDFRRNGKKQFTPEVFNSLCSQIDNVALDCEFLVFGFDTDHEPHIFTVTNPGTVNVYDRPGFWAIGSGANTALGMLFYRGQHIFAGMEETLYNACEAKFMAESASGVGAETQIYIAKYGYKAFYHGASILKLIRDEWEKHGKPKMPPDVLKKIKEEGLSFAKDEYGIPEES
jgi:20S proteasome alpha/beta subunit